MTTQPAAIALLLVVHTSSEATVSEGLADCSIRREAAVCTCAPAHRPRRSCRTRPPMRPLASERGSGGVSVEGADRAFHRRVLRDIPRSPSPGDGHASRLCLGRGPYGTTGGLACGAGCADAASSCPGQPGLVGHRCLHSAPFGGAGEQRPSVVAAERAREHPRSTSTVSRPRRLRARTTAAKA
jgi:hypothetical protein